MHRQLPSLDTLRCFEAAGRHNNFTRAAAELNVTHGAVSQRIRSLEELIGTKLFERNGNSMLPTRVGRLLLSHVTRILDDLSRTIDVLRPSEGHSHLRISFPPGLAARWLVPRLFEFTERHPDISIDIIADQSLSNLRLCNIDLAVRFGAGTWPGLEAVKLLDEEFFPVCSPCFLDKHNLGEPADLLNVTLLKDQWVSWDFWFRAVDIQLTSPLKGTSFNDANLLLQAAADGRGVALGRASLLASDLASGKLIRLFDRNARAYFSYYIVYPRGLHNVPKLALFREWLLQIASRPS